MTATRERIERKQEYMFVRAEGFYFVDYPDDESAAKGAVENPGTLMIVNTSTGKEVFNVNRN